MAHTRAWSESSPAGTDLASTIDNSVRDFKTDVREREAVDHIWNTSQDHDGKHAKVTLRPANNTTEIAVESAGSTTGSSTNGLLDLAKALNTTGVVDVLKVAITNTASGAGSTLMRMLVGGVSLFTVSLAGVWNFLDNVVQRAEIKDYSETKNLVTISSGTLTLDCETGNVFEVDLTENITTLTISNWPGTGKKGSIELWIKGDGTQRTIALGSIRTPGDVGLTPTSTDDDYTVVTFHTFDGGTTVFMLPAAFAL